jgi:hypothetical protein
VAIALPLVLASVLHLSNQESLPFGPPKTIVGIATTQITTTATSTSVSNSSDNLRFSLRLTHDSNGNLTIKVDETNLLDSVNHVKGINGWNYSPFSLNPWDNCAAGLSDGFGIASGYYDENNSTPANTLRLYDAANGQISCSESIYVHAYSFQPMSDNLTNYSDNPNQFTETTALTESLSGYWNASGSSFQHFTPGVYTVIGADQWGNVLLPHFTVISA